MRNHIGHRLVKRPEPDNTFWTDTGSYRSHELRSLGQGSMELMFPWCNSLIVYMLVERGYAMEITVEIANEHLQRTRKFVKIR